MAHFTITSCTFDNVCVERRDVDCCTTAACTNAVTVCMRREYSCHQGQCCVSLHLPNTVSAMSMAASAVLPHLYRSLFVFCFCVEYSLQNTR